MTIDIWRADFLYFYTIQLEKNQTKNLSKKNEKDLSSGSSEIAKNDKNTFLHIQLIDH